MKASELQIYNVRNLSSVNLQLGPKFNLFFGTNGSGKTSVLEAVYLLGLGRSFRQRQIKQVISHQQYKLMVHGRIVKGAEGTVSAGIERDKQGNTQIRIAGVATRRLSELAHLLPLQLINTDSYLLLNSGPKLRRQLIDWGLFHVEQSFQEIWRKYARILGHRNILLRHRASNEELQYWDFELADIGLQLHQYRQFYTERLLGYLNKAIEVLMGKCQLELDYLQGWHNQHSYLQALQINLGKDREVGYTQKGPHRADLHFKVNGHLVQDTFSRGQQKLFVYALSIAQGMLLEEQKSISCIYLIDDMAAELDQNNILKVLQLLKQTSSQIILTDIQGKSIFSQFRDDEYRMFHVEHGKAKRWYNEPS